MVAIRLQKYIAECGVASRRKAEQLIGWRRVTVNGSVVTKLGTKVDPACDKVEVDGKLLEKEETKVWVKFNKPRNVISSCRKFGTDKTILDFVKDVPCRLYPVGRLDKDSEGLMLLTNDGELANKLMHPKFEHEKEYMIRTKYQISAFTVEKLKEGVAEVELMDSKKLRIVLKEGKKRQIRLMVTKAGNRVERLKRIRISKVTLADLEEGQFAYLTPLEIDQLSMI